MLRLLTLGGTAVIDHTGAAHPAAAAQRRTLALLSVLAVAGRLGMSRDKLVALFWPEADTERGRHALTQALYAARRALRCDDLFVVSADIRLNDARMSSDVADLEAALSETPERAIALYRGPFLDGFFLQGSPEFEQWASAQRARIESDVVRALETVAARARSEGDLRSTADWWKRAAALRPLDSRVAVHVMEALAAAGDRAGALRYAAVHATLLRNDFDLEPDTAVVALTERLREPPVGLMQVEPASATDALPNDAEETSPINKTLTGVALDGEVDEAAVSRASPSPAVHDAVEVWVPQRRRARAWRLPALLLIAAGLIATGVAIGDRRRAARELRPLPQRQRVVVAPFRVAGAAASLAYLRDGMVELLSTRIADDSSARSVDAGAVIGAWRVAGLVPSVDVPRDTVVRLAARLGAERVVVGGIVGSPARIVVRATVLRVPSGAVAGQATVEGSADSIATVVDQLAVKLLVAEAGEEERLGKRTTTSLAALRAYLAGQAAFRRNDYSAAIRQYETALGRDTTFALAALRLAVAADRVDDPLRLNEGVQVAWAFRRELAERDRAILHGFVGSRFPAPSIAGDQIDAWSEGAELMPNSAEAWLALAARLFHDGVAAGVSDPRGRARAALRRALQADSGYVPATDLLAQLTAQSDGGPARQGESITPVDSMNPFSPFLQWRRGQATSDSALVRSLRASLPHLGPANLRKIAMASQFDAVGLADGGRALQILRSRDATRPHSADAILGEHSLAMNEGRIADALLATRELRRTARASHADLRLRVLDALYGDGDTLAARDAVRDLERFAAPRRDSQPATDSRFADLCILGQWRLSTGNVVAVPPMAAELRSTGPRGGAAPISAGPAACAELLDASVAVARRQRDARARVARLDSLAFTTAIAADAAVYAPLWISRLHEQLGDASGAVVALRRREYMSDWPRYLATMLREEGQLAQRTGDDPGARDAYRRYLTLRHDPDAALVAQATAVRRALERLGAADTAR